MIRGEHGATSAAAEVGAASELHIGRRDVIEFGVGGFRFDAVFGWRRAAASLHGARGFGERVFRFVIVVVVIVIVIIAIIAAMTSFAVEVRRSWIVLGRMSHFGPEFGTA